MLYVNQFILFTAVALISAVQLIVKSRLNSTHGTVPFSISDFPAFVIGALKDPWLWVAGVFFLASGYMWYFAISRIPLSVAFSFAALSYPMILTGGHFFLQETVVIQQYLGCALIVCGIFLIASYA